MLDRALCVVETCRVSFFQCGLFVCFFFFKQKTAYEIGTGDWSSDVCSSDLIGPHPLDIGCLLPAYQEYPGTP